MQIPYSPCSFTRGVKSLDPYEIRVFDQLDKDNLYRELYGTFGQSIPELLTLIHLLGPRSLFLRKL